VAAEEALQFGLANRVVAPGTALAEALTYASALSKHPQLCVRQDRDMVYR
jgi:enoyl-CoA hydratase